MGLRVLREARKNPSSQRCKLLGAHLEGPFLSKNRKGAHNPEHLCLPSLSKLDELIAAVKEGGDVFIDGSKAGNALVLASSKSS